MIYSFNPFLRKSLKWNLNICTLARTRKRLVFFFSYLFSFLNSRKHMPQTTQLQCFLGDDLVIKWSSYLWYCSTNYSCHYCNRVSNGNHIMEKRWFWFSVTEISALPHRVREFMVVESLPSNGSGCLQRCLKVPDRKHRSRG